MKNVTNKKDKAVLIACVVMLIMNVVIWTGVFVVRNVVEKTTITATEVTGTAYVLNENGEWEPLDQD